MPPRSVPSLFQALTPDLWVILTLNAHPSLGILGRCEANHWLTGVFLTVIWCSSRRRMSTIIEPIHLVDSYKDLWHTGTDLSPAGIKRHHWLLLHFISPASPPSGSKQGQRSISAGRSCQGCPSQTSTVWWRKSQHTYNGRVWIIVMKSPVLIQRTGCLNNPKESRISHNPGCAGWGETRPWMQTHSAVSTRLLVCSLLKVQSSGLCA